MGELLGSGLSGRSVFVGKKDWWVCRTGVGGRKSIVLGQG